MVIDVTQTISAAYARYAQLGTVRSAPAAPSAVFSAVAPASVGPAATLELSGAAPAGQSLTLTQDQWLSLGTLNGKPFNVHPLAHGEMEWTGGRQAHAGVPGTTLTPEELRLGDAANAYTPKEQAYADRIVGTVHVLDLVASGKVSTDFFNDWAQRGGPGVSQIASPADIRDATSRLGINMDQPFSVNGKKLQFIDGNLVDA